MLKTKISAALAAGSLLLSTVSPAFAATTLEVTGNGSDSKSNVNFTQNRNVSVVQNNDANVENKIDVKANTGDNSADDNTGGDVKVKTGESKVEIEVSNLLNKNAASVDCCETGDVEVKVSGNGSDSENKASLDLGGKKEIFQNNNADVKNDVEVDQTTGKNDTDDNTGGDVTVETGKAWTGVKLLTAANANSAKIGGGDSNGGSLSAWITGNGSDSDNTIDLDLGGDTSIVQENNADVENDVDVDQETGDNSAEDNTGGNVKIKTGLAHAIVAVDNLVNFNVADVDCGCVLDVEAKVAANGTDSENEIKGELGNDLELFQGEKSNADLDNDVEVDGDTGDNDADDNTGAYDESSDPSIETGAAHSDTGITNAGNVNVFGQGDVDLDLDFDWDSLLDFLGL